MANFTVLVILKINKSHLTSIRRWVNNVTKTKKNIFNNNKAVNNYFLFLEEGDF